MLHNERGTDPTMKGNDTMTANEKKLAELEAQAEALETTCANDYATVEFRKTRYGKGSTEHRVALGCLSRHYEELRKVYMKIKMLEKTA